MTWALVAVSGGLGALARYSITLMVGPREFPLATLGINVSGSFLLGLLLTFAAEDRLSPQMTTALAVGFLGAFTTYSTFSWEALTLGRAGQMTLALLYVLSSIVLGLVAAAVGFRIGQSLSVG